MTCNKFDGTKDMTPPPKKKRQFWHTLTGNKNKMEWKLMDGEQIG